MNVKIKHSCYFFNLALDSIQVRQASVNPNERYFGAKSANSQSELNVLSQGGNANLAGQLTSPHFDSGTYILEHAEHFWPP